VNIGCTLFIMEFSGTIRADYLVTPVRQKSIFPIILAGAVTIGGRRTTSSVTCRKKCETRSAMKTIGA